MTFQAALAKKLSILTNTHLDYECGFHNLRHSIRAYDNDFEVWIFVYPSVYVRILSPLQDTHFCYVEKNFDLPSLWDRLFNRKKTIQDLSTRIMDWILSLRGREASFFLSAVVRFQADPSRIAEFCLSVGSDLSKIEIPDSVREEIRSRLGRDSARALRDSSSGIVRSGMFR